LIVEYAADYKLNSVKTRSYRSWSKNIKAGVSLNKISYNKKKRNKR